MCVLWLAVSIPLDFARVEYKGQPLNKQLRTPEVTAPPISNLLVVVLHTPNMQPVAQRPSVGTWLAVRLHPEVSSVCGEAPLEVQAKSWADIVEGTSKGGVDGGKLRTSKEPTTERHTTRTVAGSTRTRESMQDRSGLRNE